jgi:hypothetical protein
MESAMHACYIPQLRPVALQMPYRVLEIQPTPNPNAQKFVLDRVVSDPPMSFFNAESAVNHPLAGRLFSIEGVSSLLLLGDFVTVNKRPDASWAAIRQKVKQVLSAAP